MKTKTIRVRKTSVYRDGGTKGYIDKNGKQYFRDFRIGSKTKGKVFDKYPSEKDAEVLTGIKLVSVSELGYQEDEE